MPSNQELFAKQLSAYRKVVALNYMAHKEVYEVLREVVAAEARDGFVFVDLGCGTATASVAALKDTAIGRYVGIDTSEPSLAVAREAVKELCCPAELRCQDFVAAIEAWSEPLDVVWIGQSLHHLQTPGKQAFMHRVRELLPARGLFLIWEPTCLEGEDRNGWFERFGRLRPVWSGISDADFAAFDTHNRASDYAETASTWLSLGRNAGFRRAEELLTVPNKLARLYRFSG